MAHPALAAGVLTVAFVMIDPMVSVGADTLIVGAVNGKPVDVPTGVETFNPVVVTL